MRTVLAKALSLLSIVCILLSVFSIGVNAETVQREVVTDFSKTNVLDDLKSSTVNGKAFDLKDYPLPSSLR